MKRRMTTAIGRPPNENGNMTKFKCFPAEGQTPRWGGRNGRQNCHTPDDGDQFMPS